jgi:hypothetical protein
MTLIMVPNPDRSSGTFTKADQPQRAAAASANTILRIDQHRGARIPAFYAAARSAARPGQNRRTIGFMDIAGRLFLGRGGVRQLSVGRATTLRSKSATSLLATIGPRNSSVFWR